MVSPRFPHSGLQGNHLWASGLSDWAYLCHRNTNNANLRWACCAQTFSAPCPEVCPYMGVLPKGTECQSVAAWLPQSLKAQHGLLRKGYMGLTFQVLSETRLQGDFKIMCNYWCRHRQCGIKMTQHTEGSNLLWIWFLPTITVVLNLDEKKQERIINSGR